MVFYHILLPFSCTLHFFFLFSRFVFTVPVCLSIDVTGALVPPFPVLWILFSFLLRVFRFCSVHVTPTVLIAPFLSPLFALLLRPCHSPLPSSFFRACVSVHRRDRCTRTPLLCCFSLGFFVPLSLFLCPSRTGVSVHRRDRCVCTLLPLLLLAFPSSFSGHLYWRVCP